METSYKHTPVMCEEILDLLAGCLDQPGALLVDATLGLGGHAHAALERFPFLHLVGIDRDPLAIEMAHGTLGQFLDRFETHLVTYDQITEVLDGRRADGILCDLGVSSMQIDSPQRGFAYAYDAPLSMRMDGDDEQITAADVVNTYSLDDLIRILRIYGDEKHAVRIARAILDERDRQPFVTSARLVSTIEAAVGPTRSGHPAKRVFQAIRMEVNDERSCLVKALPACLGALAPGGRLAVLSYHSGEDRLVKQAFARAAADQVPQGMPVVPEHYRAGYQLVTRGAVKPSAAEVARNPRSGSARLRVIQKVSGR